jgi:hypothetical protein
MSGWASAMLFRITPQQSSTGDTDGRYLGFKIIAALLAQCRNPAHNPLSLGAGAVHQKPRIALNPHVYRIWCWVWCTGARDQIYRRRNTTGPRCFGPPRGGKGLNPTPSVGCNQDWCLQAKVRTAATSLLGHRAPNFSASQRWWCRR